MGESLDAADVHLDVVVAVVLADELVRKVTGQLLSVEPFKRYVGQMVAEVYG